MGMSVEEIARATELPVEKVRSLASKSTTQEQAPGY
jgi:DNA-directed RNA polymerase specialized sigma24 family protein